MAYENIRFSKPNMVVHDGYFYMMDETRNVLFQKLDDGETAFVYPLSVELNKKVVFDDFEGETGTPFNPKLWTSNTTITDNRAVLTNAPSTQHVTGTNKILLAGDFDISVDYGIIDGPSANSWGAVLEARFADASRLWQVVRAFSGGSRRYYRQYYNGTNWVNYSYANTSDTSGRLRITRSGNVFTCFYWSAGAWVSLGGVTTAIGTDMYPRVSCNRWDTNPTATVYFDNFTSIVPLGNPVQLEHDGINYWTLQNYTGNAGFVVRRWQTHNYTCDLHEDVDVFGSYDVNAFTVEHYHDTLASGVNTDDDVILLTDYTDTIVSGSQLTLGPDLTGLNYEDVHVVAVSGSNIILSSGVLYNYPENSNVNFYTNLWVFNSVGDGTLHKIDAYSGDVLANYQSGIEYDNITACTFFKARGVESSPVDALIYIKGTTLKYLNVDDMTLYGIMTIDNSIPSPPETLVVYDLALEDINIYRLQIKARYFGTNHTWATYNYVLSTTRRFVDTINVSVYPVILPANAINTSKVTAIVNDQYGDGVWEKPVYFTDDDPIGFITTTPAFTDNFFGTGAAISGYKAGTSVRLVTIEGTAVHFD